MSQFQLLVLSVLQEVMQCTCTIYEECIHVFTYLTNLVIHDNLTSILDQVHVHVHQLLLRKSTYTYQANLTQITLRTCTYSCI